MPELPEVETVARGLQQSVAGRRILSVSLGKTDFIENPELLAEELPGRRIQSVRRYGKFMLLRLSPPESQPQGARHTPSAEGESPALLVHLGMTGSLAAVPAGVPPLKHTHVVLPLDDGRELRYVDPRRFGRMAFLTRTHEMRELAAFGADPLEIGKDDFARLVRSRRARLKALLLDQGVLRGVGNIYADESLWRARIHPARLGSSLSLSQAHLLHRALQAILKRAIVLRGSSIANFLDPDGRPGEYQQHHRAYGREGKPCGHCGARIRRVIIAGRSSYYCPRCQRAPAGWRAVRGKRNRS